MNKAASYSPNHSMSPRVYFFAPKRWRVGIVHAIESLFLIFAGAFLLLEIHKVPNLKIQMLIMGFGMLIGGLALARVAFVDFLGFLRLDADGIHIRNRPQCESFSWDRITALNLGNADNSYDFGRFIEFSIAGDSRGSRTIDGKYLRSEQLSDIRDILARYHNTSNTSVLFAVPERLHSTAVPKHAR